MATKHVTDKMVCEAVAEYQRELDAELAALSPGTIFGLRAVQTEWPYDKLMRRTGECMKVCYRAMERACDRGYLEYGVSLRTAWLTDKGKALLGLDT